MKIRDMQYGLAQELELPPSVEGKVEETYQMIRQRAKQQTPAGRRGEKGRRKRITKILLPAAAILLLGCGAAVAGDLWEISLFQNWIFSNPVNNEIADEIVEVNPDIAYEQENPLLAIREIYIDGTKLIFTADAAGMKGFVLEAKDHAYINGIDCMNEGFVPVEGETNRYQCTIALPDELADNTLRVSVNLYTPTGVQEFGFTVQTAQLEWTKKISDQLFTANGYKIRVSDISVAPSETSFKLCYECEDVQTEAQFAEAAWRVFYKVEDSNGERLDLLSQYACTSIQPVQEKTGGIRQWEQEITLYGFDYTSEYIRMIPYISEEDEEGKLIPDTGTVYEEWAFTISLTE